MRKKIFTTLIFFLVAMALVSCGVPRKANIKTEPVVNITEEVADACLPLPAGETEQVSDGQSVSATASVKVETEKEPRETEKEPAAGANSHTEEPEKIKEDAFACTLSVRCDTVFDNIGKMNPEKLAILPRDGIIFPKSTVVFFAGESVFNLLTRELKKSRIHIDFTNTPMYNTVYIKGISNLYEKDCGELSGWVYFVNGQVPSYGCSQYIIQDGDDIAFVYTCDLGKDVR